MSGTTLNGAEICQHLDKLAASGIGFDSLLSSAVEQLHTANPRFHWTGIYELFPDNILRLGPFIGAPTDHVFISVGRGVCGSAVAERRDKNVPDVSKEPNYLACSSATKSELVVLIRKGETIFAQIDIDSHDLDAFDGTTESEVRKVADWLADHYQAQRRA
ncbi:MAG TPA: GAF domain-containing protein [Candidatus Krumholzibacteria bacterium]|nr:GAF domain-containing protein [Candidatus Krumholzibacteria bacterium]